jgi:protein TonB
MYASAARPGNRAWEQLRKIGPFSAIVLLHVGFFYALQSGLLHKAVDALPREVIVSFITPEPVAQPEPPKAQPVPPKTVPVVKHHVTPPTPVPVTKPATEEPPIAVAQAIAQAPVTQPVAVQAAPIQPPAPAMPKTISTGVEYLQAPRPEYPSFSRRMSEQGKVTLRVLVNEQGHPERVEVQHSSGIARLDEAARQAVLRAVFKPHREDGKAVAVYAIVPINFQLDS